MLICCLIRCPGQNNDETLVNGRSSLIVRWAQSLLPPKQQFLWSLSDVIQAVICLQSERCAFKHSKGVCPAPVLLLSPNRGDVRMLWEESQPCSRVCVTPAAIPAQLCPAESWDPPGPRLRLPTPHTTVRSTPGRPRDTAFLQHCRKNPQHFHLPCISMFELITFMGQHGKMNLNTSFVISGY